MEIYLAARYSRLDEMNTYAQQLRSEGHYVPAKWLLGEHQAQETVDAVESATKSVPITGAGFAMDDINDIWSANALITFSETPRSGHSRGGRHIEFGMASCLEEAGGTSVGPRENVFHTLPQVQTLLGMGAGRAGISESHGYTYQAVSI